DRRQLQFFLGFEVCVEAALAHPHLGGQVADRQAIQPSRRRQLRRGEQDGGATGLAFRGVGLVAGWAVFFGRSGVHDLTIARTVVIIKVSIKNERSCFLLPWSPRSTSCSSTPDCVPSRQSFAGTEGASARPFSVGLGSTNR